MDIGIVGSEVPARQACIELRSVDLRRTPCLNEQLVFALLVLVSLPFAGIVVYTMGKATTEIEGEMHVGDLHDSKLAVPKGHIMATTTESKDEGDKLGWGDKVGHVSVEHVGK
jgi:hypothetical protein